MVQYANTCTTDEGQQTPCVLPRIMYIRATMQGLEYPLLPFALLKSDPLVEMKQYLRTRPMVTPGVGEMRGAWNRPFAGIRLDQLHFIFAWNSVPGTSARVLHAAGLTFAIATCGPFHRRWLTTRPVWCNGELVTWCQAIDMHDIEPNPVITLSEANMIRLSAAENALGYKVA